MACQKPSAPSAIASSGPITSPRRFRSSSSPFQDCAFSRTPSVRPTSSLLAFGCRPDDDEQALRIVFEPGLHVDAVGPEVDVALDRQIPLLPAGGLVRPGVP